MVLAYDTRRMTRDVDAVFEPKADVYAAAKVVAQALELPDDWINEAVKGFSPGPIRTSSVDHGPNHVVSASRNPASVPSPTQATCPSGLISTAVGAGTEPSSGNSHGPAHSASTT